MNHINTSLSALQRALAYSQIYILPITSPPMSAWTSADINVVARALRTAIGGDYVTDCGRHYRENAIEPWIVGHAGPIATLTRLNDRVLMAIRAKISKR